MTAGGHFDWGISGLSIGGDFACLLTTNRNVGRLQSSSITGRSNLWHLPNGTYLTRMVGVSNGAVLPRDVNMLVHCSTTAQSCAGAQSRIGNSAKVERRRHRGCGLARRNRHCRRRTIHIYALLSDKDDQAPGYNGTVTSGRRLRAPHQRSDCFFY
jgi:hypothetical protein